MTLTKEFVNSCRKVGVLRDFLCQAIDQVDEKDKEIAELKESYKDMDVTHTVHIAKMNAKIEELEAAIEEKDCDYKTVKLWNENATKEREELYERITELEKQLESEKASRYAESVDAGMRERRLKRALWLTRLRTLRNFSVLAYFQTLRAKGKKSNMDFDEIAYRIDLARVKCRAKAEEYK